MPSVMRAAIVEGPGKVSVRQIAPPSMTPDDILVRMEGCGICASNIPVWEGRSWFTYPISPGAPGHEGWGRVESIGENVTGFSVGDRVALLSQRAFAEYDTASAEMVVRLPESMGNLPFPGEPAACAINIFERSYINPGDTVAIIGIGFIGALLTSLAKGAGARVIAISRRQYSLETARLYGAEEAIPLDDHRKVIEKVMGLTGGRGCDRVIEATGHQWPLDLAGELTRERGRLIIAGYHQDGPRQINMQLWNWRGLDVINAHERDPRKYLEGMRKAVDHVLQRRFDITPLLTHSFPLDRLGEAFTLAVTRPEGFMKALVSI